MSPSNSLASADAPVCLTCGEGRVREQPTAGKVFSYRDAPEVRVPDHVDLAVPTCNVCGEQYLTPEKTAALDVSLEREYRRMRQGAQDAAIRSLKTRFPRTRQSDFEEILGMSAGYLSKLRNDRRSPAPMTWRYLELAAKASADTLRELAREAGVSSDVIARLQPDTVSESRTRPARDMSAMTEGRAARVKQAARVAKPNAGARARKDSTAQGDMQPAVGRIATTKRG